MHLNDCNFILVSFFKISHNVSDLSESEEN